LLSLFVIELFRLTQVEGILSIDVSLKISFNLGFKSSLLLLCIYVFYLSHSELYLLRLVSGKLNEYVMLWYVVLWSCATVKCRN